MNCYELNKDAIIRLQQAGLFLALLQRRRTKPFLQKIGYRTLDLADDLLAAAAGQCDC